MNVPRVPPLKLERCVAALSGALGMAFAMGSQAQATFTEDFTGTATVNTWYYTDGACLTAGTAAGTGTPGTVAGYLPSCVSIQNSYYAPAHVNYQPGDAALVGGTNGVAGNSQTLPDPATQGALRFTNGAPYGYGEHGSIVASTPFNSTQGVQITFKTVTYRGNSGGQNGSSDGADGIGFYLIDATQFRAYSPLTSSPVWNGIGAYGGSLGYTCSNTNPPYDGLIGAYLGLGIDEFGNFLNAGDNTASGFGIQPGRIGLRGAGNVSWNYLNATYPADYPTSTLNTAALRQAAVQKTCITGQVWNYAGSATVPVAVANPSPALLDYAALVSSVLPATSLIANEAAMSRGAATTIFYNLKITPAGLLSFGYNINNGAYTPVITAQSISALDAALPSSLLFGFAGSTGGSTNIHEILCFKAAPSNESASSSAVDLKQTAKLQTVAQAYFAYYNPNDWTGRVTANNLVDTAGVLSITALSNWDAQCNLTGVAALATCATTGASGPLLAQPPANRVMWTWNGLSNTASPGSAGTSFEWPGAGSGTPITASEQTQIDAGDAAPPNANRLNYLRGDRSNEINSRGIGPFRVRDGVLGDIIDSSPTWEGPPSAPYAQRWVDRLIATDAMVENSGTSYQSFETAQQSRLNVIYVGANDGFLHAFRTGSLSSTGTIVDNSTTRNDGAEILAYMPGAILNTIHPYSTVPATEAGDAFLDYANLQYSHNYFVDATPATGDLFYGGAWHTWLVGGLGVGGAAIYALDVTNPATFSESTATYPSPVIGEWSASTIVCASTPTSCGGSLGNTYGTPQVRRFHNGSWGAVFGNGYGSTNGDAGIYVMLINPTSGVITFYYLSAGHGPANGIGFVASADLDGDHITDYVYAGDLQGEIWRFDLTSASPSNWAVSTGPLFKTSAGQPITTQLILAAAPVSGTLPALLVAFGTGQRTQPTTTSGTTYASSAQSLYGVWDWDMSAWNAKSASAPYASLTAAQVLTRLPVAHPIGPANLTQQVFSVNASSGVIDATRQSILWEQCGSVCNAGSFGWYANLPGSSPAAAGSPATFEQIVSTPTLDQSAFIVNSTIPANNAILSCSINSDRGVTYVLSVTSGATFVVGGAAATGSPSYSTAFVHYTDTAMVGLVTNETGSLSLVNTVEGTSWLVGQAITPPPPGGTLPPPTQINPPTNTLTHRLTWVELR